MRTPPREFRLRLKASSSNKCTRFRRLSGDDRVALTIDYFDNAQTSRQIRSYEILTLTTLVSSEHTYAMYAVAQRP